MKKNILEDGMDERFLDIYVDATKLEYHKRRYVQAIELFEAHYGAGEAEIFSAPGRSEVVETIRIINMERFWLHPSTLIRLALSDRLRIIKSESYLMIMMKWLSH